MKSAARDIPERGPIVEPSGGPMTDQPPAERPESPEERTIAFPAVRDAEPAPVAGSPAADGAPAQATGADDREAAEAPPAGERDAVPPGAEDGGDAAGTGTPDAAEQPAAEAEDSGATPQPEAGEAREQDAGQTGADGVRVREEALPSEVSAALTNALAELRAAVQALHFGLDMPGAEEARKAQAALLAQIDNYVIPRVRYSTAPALIVVAGSTGAGKSTLVNTIAGKRVAVTGVRRPTTSIPVLVCHPDDHDWYARGELLSGVPKYEGQQADAGPDGIILASSDQLPRGIALLDTPDIDSVVEQNHEIAHRMLDAADLWMFVTTAARYADAPSWGLLRRAKERNARLIIVVSRVPAKSRDVILKHYGRMLDEYGLGDVERFVIHETTVRDGRLADEEIADLRAWLSEFSADDRRREAAVKATLNGVFNSFKSRLPALARHLEAQVALRADLRADVDAAYMGAIAEIDEATRNGSLLQGEALARWQDFAGSGDLMRTIQLRRGGKGRQRSPERLQALRSAMAKALEAVILSAAQRATEEVAQRWGQRAGVGDRLVTPALGRPADDFAERTSASVAAWQDYVTELMRTEGVAKRSVAKIVSFDIDSLALIFMVGLLGYGTSDVADGKGALPQRLLRRLLGAESLRNISAKARSDLRARIRLLFDEEMLRYVDALDSAGIPDEAAATRLYQATYNLEAAR